MSRPDIMPSMVRASELVCKALKIKPQGVEAQSKNWCAYCGACIASGALISHLELGQSFTDHALLAHPSGKWVCASCKAMTSATVMRQVRQCICSDNGDFISLRARQNVIDALLNPPKAPFVWVYGTRNLQHMVWHAPVTFDPNFIHARISTQTFLIRRRRLAHYLACIILLTETLQQLARALGSRKKYLSPFLVFNAQKEAKSMELNPRLLRFFDDDSVDEGLDKTKPLQAWRDLQGMTQGELWALTFLRVDAQANYEQLTKQFS